MSATYPHTRARPWPWTVEAAATTAAQGPYWKRHDLLFDNQAAPGGDEDLRCSRRLGLDPERFDRELTQHAYAPG